MTKNTVKLLLSKLLLGPALLLIAMQVIFPGSLMSQEPPDAAPAVTAPSPAPETEPSGELDFNMDTAEFEDFGEEGFVADEKLDPKTETAVTVVKVIAGIVGLLILFWLIRRLLSGARSSTAG